MRQLLNIFENDWDPESEMERDSGMPNEYQPDPDTDYESGNLDDLFRSSHNFTRMPGYEELPEEEPIELVDDGSAPETLYVLPGQLPNNGNVEQWKKAKYHENDQGYRRVAFLVKSTDENKGLWIVRALEYDGYLERPEYMKISPGAAAIFLKGFSESIRESINLEEDIKYNYMPQKALAFMGVSGDLLDNPEGFTSNPEGATVLKIEKAERIEYIFSQLAESAKVVFRDYGINDQLLRSYFSAVLIVLARTHQDTLEIKALGWMRTPDSVSPADWVVENL